MAPDQALFGYHRGWVDRWGFMTVNEAHGPFHTAADAMDDDLRYRGIGAIGADLLRAPELVGLASQHEGLVGALRRPWDPIVFSALLSYWGRTRELLESIDGYFGTMGYPAELEQYSYITPARDGDPAGVDALYDRIATLAGHHLRHPAHVR